MRTLTRAMTALQRGTTWIKATMNPHVFDPYEREPIYYGALVTPMVTYHTDRGRRAMTRAHSTARNHVRYPLD